MSIWQYSGHIVREATAYGSRSRLAWFNGMVSPEAREQAEHVEGPAQLRQTTSIAKEVPSLMYAIVDRNIIEDN